MLEFSIFVAFSPKTFLKAEVQGSIITLRNIVKHILRNDNDFYKLKLSCCQSVSEY